MALSDYYNSPSGRASDAMEYERMRREMRYELDRMRHEILGEVRYYGGGIQAVPQGTYTALVATTASTEKPKEKNEKLQKIISYYYTRKN